MKGNNLLRVLPLLLSLGLCGCPPDPDIKKNGGTDSISVTTNSPIEDKPNKISFFIENGPWILYTFIR